MPLSVRFDNRLDRLADALIVRLSEPAGGPVLATHPVIVPSLGVGRWLQQRIAQQTGVCAGVEPELPGRLLWRWLRELLPGLPAQSPFAPDVVRWRLLGLFDELADAPEAVLAPLRERLAGAPLRQRLATATELAMLFDRYLAWRRDWLQRWEAGQSAAPGLGPHEGWQAWLWRRLLATMPDLADVHPYERFAGLIADDPQGVRSVLGGRRLSLLGMPAMAPAQIELFGLLGEVADIAFYVPDPCREWWEDLVDSRQRARVLAMRPDDAWLYDGEPSVLGDWGRAQRDFVAQLAALQERFDVQASEPFRLLDDPDGDLLDGDDAADSGADTDIGLRADVGAGAAPDCLRALRRSVFLRSNSPWDAIAAPDDSIVFHAAHSTTRQAEVLHDHLLDCFERLPQLHPAEIVVFCADIANAAPAIEAVFASVEPARRIPLWISGRPPDSDPLLRAVRELLILAGTGPTLAGVEAWLLNPAVAAATGLGVDEVAALVRTLDAAGARWGLIAEEGALKHNWQDALDRLLIGAAVADDVSLVGELAPVAGWRGSRSALAGPVLKLLEVLAELRQLAAAPGPVALWCERFGAAVDRIFADVPACEASLTRLRAALAGLADSALAAADGDAARVALVDGPAFALALDEVLHDVAPAASAGGAVTVCPIGALRGVPFRVVCLFGFDEGVFPRRAGVSETDLMARAPRFGDRLARIDERGLFLDAVLAAGDRLAVLFRGRDARDDSVLNPSPVVVEMLAWLRARFVGEGLPAERMPMPAGGCAAGIVEHPLHPFSPRAFDPERSGSRAVPWLAAAQALARPLASRARSAGPVAGPALGAPGERTDPEGGWRSDDRMSDALMSDGVASDGVIMLSTLRDALADPLSFWLRHGVGAALRYADAAIDDREPLWPEAGGQRSLLDQVAQTLLAGGDRDHLLRWLQAWPETAGGSVGRRQAVELLAQADALVRRAGGVQPGGDAGLALRLSADTVLYGQVPTVPADGALRRVSGFPLNMRGLVDAWLTHALIAAVQAQGGAGSVPLVETCLVTPDATTRLQIADPQAALQHALTMTAGILAEPPVAFPRAWLAGWRKATSTTTLGQAMMADEGLAAKVCSELRAKLEPRRRSTGGRNAGGPVSGERDKPWQQVFWRDAQPSLARIVADGDRLWAPVLACVEIGKA